MMQAFLAVLNMSIASTILLAMVLVWRWALRQYGAAGFRCLVWLPFLFRLLVPYSFPSGFSVYNLIPGRLEKPGGALLSIAYLDTAALGEQSLAAGQNLAYKQLLGLACGIWAAGAAAMLLYMAAQYLWQRISLTTAYRLPENETASYAARAGQRKPSPVLCTGAVRGPLVFGLVHPRVLLPLSLWEQPHGREYILLHEFTHIRWGDHVVLMAANLALALHWFNPLVWLARRRMAQDIERACDARVLRGLERQQQLAYAQALVDWAGRRSGWNGYAAFGDRDVSQRVRGVLAWKRLPRWAELLLGAAMVACFLCTATNPLVRADTYLPVSSPFVSEADRDLFRAAAWRLAEGLENADPLALAGQASMDAAYFAPLYEELAGMRLEIDGMRLYCNSADAAELYIQVTVRDGAGVYASGEGVLVAHMVRTGYRPEPFVDCLMPQAKYESMRRADTGSEAARLAVRLCAELEPGDFEAQSLSSVTVARVCMASAIQDKGETSPFSPARMEQLAREYFDLEDFSCRDPAVFDAAAGTYYYETTSTPRMCVTGWENTSEGGVRVTVESYEDPLCLYPLSRLECEMRKAG